VKQRSVRVSANSFLRRAKGLFSSSTIKHLEAVKLPSPLPFEGVAFEKRPSMRYRSGFDVFGLIETAREELSQAEPEQFKIFLLAVMAGLRRHLCREPGAPARGTSPSRRSITWIKGNASFPAWATCLRPARARPRVSLLRRQKSREASDLPRLGGRITRGRRTMIHFDVTPDWCLKTDRPVFASASILGIWRERRSPIAFRKQIGYRRRSSLSIELSFIQTGQIPAHAYASPHRTRQRHRTLERRRVPRLA
jgi:hypothetical protein